MATAMPPPVTQPQTALRRNPLQFSLRWLLILVTLSAIGLAVYRWEWQVVKFVSTASDEPETIRVTTYHYGWNRKPLKHGPERTFQLSADEGTEVNWSEGEFILERMYAEGRLRSIGTHSATKQTKQVSAAKANSQSDITGVWRFTRHRPGELITQSVAWRNGQRHGRSTWKSATGGLLHSADFEKGQVIRWNDKSVAEEFRRWANERVTDLELRNILFTTLRNSQDYQHTAVNDLGVVWIPTQPGPPFLMHFGFNAEYSKLPSRWQERFRGRVFGEVLLECALNNWSVLDFRYGCVYTVPMSSDRRPWTDPTGSDRVHFEKDSAADFYWNQLVTTDPDLEVIPAARLRDLFRETNIQVDTTAVNHFDPPLLAGRPHRAALPHYPRLRRQLFGHVLFTHGYVCEQQGNVLVIRKGADLQ